jgi:hypothetical protein
MNLSKIGSSIAAFVSKLKRWIGIAKEVVDDVDDVIDETKEVIDKVGDLSKRKDNND